MKKSYLATAVVSAGAATAVVSTGAGAGAGATVVSVFTSSVFLSSPELQDARAAIASTLKSFFMCCNFFDLFKQLNLRFILPFAKGNPPFMIFFDFLWVTI
jgi:hypothetical protein